MARNEKTPLLDSQEANPSASSTFAPFLIEDLKTPLPFHSVPRRQSRRHKRNKCGRPDILSLILLIGLIVAGLSLVVFLVILFTRSDAPKSPQLIQSVLKQSNNYDYKDIDIPQGRLRGFTKKSRQGRDYTAYFKVPYAEPPIGDLRFKDPVPPKDQWEGTRSFKSVAMQCIHKEKESLTPNAVGEEDCLYANIYVPSTSEPEEGTTASLPVIVYIHGGGWIDGNGSRYGADYFMDEGAILITFQYRLGPFGYLNTGDDVIHGNMGFKDMIQMLKWTKDTANYFGGDPNRVTILGHSTGGLTVSFILASPMANGLFHRAITQSNANLCGAHNFVISDPSKTIDEVGSILNCDATDSTKFLDCLRGKNASEIAVASSIRTRYALTIENRDDDQVFMPDTPYNILKNGKTIKVPYIIGVVNAESASEGIVAATTEMISNALNRNFSTFAGLFLDVDLNDDELLEIKNFYFGDKEIGNDTFREAINLVSDRSFVHCSYATASMHSEFGPTYLYYLTKPPAKSYIEKSVPGFPAKELGLVSHADELQYFFLYDGYPEIRSGDPEYFEFSSYLVKQWANFAAYGSLESDWHPILPGSSANTTFWYELNDKPGKTDSLRERMGFWDRFTHKQLKYDVEL